METELLNTVNGWKLDKKLWEKREYDITKGNVSGEYKITLSLSILIPKRLLREPAEVDVTEEASELFYTCSQSRSDSYYNSIDAARFKRFSDNLETKFLSNLKARLNDQFLDYDFGSD